MSHLGAHSTSIRTDCLTCQVRQQTEWCALEHDNLDQLQSVKRARHYLPGDVLYHEGDESCGVFCIQSGMLGIRKADAEGLSTMLRLVYPGQTLGYGSFLSGREHHDTAEILKPSVVCFLDGAPVRRMLTANPALGLRFLQRAVHDLDDADERILHSVTMSVRARFTHLLLVLKERYSAETNAGAVTFELPLSRQDLAAMIGARPETMSRTIKQMQDEGFAQFDGRRVVIPALEHLVAELEMDGYH